MTEPICVARPQNLLPTRMIASTRKFDCECSRVGLQACVRLRVLPSVIRTHGCIYKKFLRTHEESLRLAIQNAVGRLVETQTFFREASIKMFCICVYVLIFQHSNNVVWHVKCSDKVITVKCPTWLYFINLLRDSICVKR